MHALYLDLADIVLRHGTLLLGRYMVSIPNIAATSCDVAHRLCGRGAKDRLHFPGRNGLWGARKRNRPEDQDMRLVSFKRKDGSAGYGTTDGTRVHDASAVLGERYPDLRAVIAADALSELEGAGPALELADVTLLPPITNPEKDPVHRAQLPAPHPRDRARQAREADDLYPLPRQRRGPWQPAGLPRGERPVRLRGRACGHHRQARPPHSPRPTPGIKSQGIPASTTAPSAISRATRHSSGRARISRRRAASARGLSPPTRSATSPAQSLTTRVNGNVEQHTPDQATWRSPSPSSSPMPRP